MSRYVTKAWTGDDVLETSHELNDDASYTRSMTVFSTDQDPVPTGLYDHTGQELYRMPDTIRCGFWTGTRK